MPKLYKIHPGVGIARVGPSSDGFYLTGEPEVDGPFELSEAENIPFSGYKDENFLVRRQGARFRIYEYEVNEATGQQLLIREITSNDAKIEWRVELVNSKAAGPSLAAANQGYENERVMLPNHTSYRNKIPSGFSRDDMKSKATISVSGTNEATGPINAPYLGRDWFIGEGQTDYEGRLIVLGGRGAAESWTTPAKPLRTFLSNPGWMDDVADGPVDVKITFPDGREYDYGDDNVSGAWVIVGPPDFAPDAKGVSTLSDVVKDAAHRRGLLSIPTPVSFHDDILPIFQRAASLFWVNDGVTWEDVRDLLSGDVESLADPSDASANDRIYAYDLLMDSKGDLTDMRFPPYLKTVLKLWLDGSFVPGPVERGEFENTARALDELSLKGSVGGGFFPGIEAGFLLSEPSLYSEPYRVNRKSFVDHDGEIRQVEGGMFTQRMALPWQADFTDCVGRWWPSQRPDLARNSAGEESWDRGIISSAGGRITSQDRLNMVDHFAQLGVIQEVEENGNVVQRESGRDPALPS